MPAKLKNKSSDYLAMFSTSFYDKVKISEITYRRALKELDNDLSANAVSAVGFAHAAFGNAKKADEWFSSFLMENNSTITNNYCLFLLRSCMYKRLNEMALNFFKDFNETWLTLIAAEHVYSLGRIQQYKEIMHHCANSIQNKEKKERVISMMNIHVEKLEAAYSISGCSAEQLEKITSYALGVLEQNSVSLKYIDISSATVGDTSYIIDIKTENPILVSSLNSQLANAICGDNMLDECDIIAFYTNGRIAKDAVHYVD